MSTTPKEQPGRSLARMRASWRDSPLRSFVHIDARPCQVCNRITQNPPCAACRDGFESVDEIDRPYPASLEAYAYFMREAEQLERIEETVRNIAHRERGGAVYRIRWKTANEIAYGTPSFKSANHTQQDSFDNASVMIESIADDLITLIAFGVPCACNQSDWQLRPGYVRRWIGRDDHGEVLYDICTSCGATWLKYLYVDHFGNGSTYRGLIAPNLARELKATAAVSLLEALPWYWVGGTYHFGKTYRGSGTIRWH